MYSNSQIERLVPVVRNLYQTQKQILLGFMTSLIHKELVANFTWTGKGDFGNKFCFNDLKQIQTVLFSAMIKIDSNYSLAQFKSDLQRNLAKCANEMGRKRTLIMSVNTEPTPECKPLDNIPNDSCNILNDQENTSTPVSQ